MRQCAKLAVLMLSMSVTTSALAIGELIGGDLNFKGTVAALGCSIVPTSENVAVNFGEISTRTLYAQGKSTPQQFVIELQDCSTDVFDSVSVTFSGTENSNLSDHIAITSVAPGGASGIGIGLQENDGTDILLDTPTKAVLISGSTMQLSFKAFVEGEPDALSNKTLQTGAFQATANYTINYQ